MEPDYERIETILTLIKEKNKFGDKFDWKICPPSLTNKVPPLVKKKTLTDKLEEGRKTTNNDMEEEEDKNEMPVGKGDQERKRKKSRIIKKVVKIVH